MAYFKDVERIEIVKIHYRNEFCGKRCGFFCYYNALSRRTVIGSLQPMKRFVSDVNIAAVSEVVGQNPSNSIR